MPKLTARQLRIRRFALEYVRDFNGTRAAIAVGFSARRATVTASELLDDEQVQAEIERVMKQREKRSRVKAFRILEHLAPLIESNVEHYVVTNDGKFALAEGAPVDAMLAVASVKHKITQRPSGSVFRTVEFRLHSKSEAQRLGMQHLGMLKERVELTGKDGAAIAQELTVRFVRPTGDGGR